jgi:hypothetical protein
MRGRRGGVVVELEEGAGGQEHLFGCLSCRREEMGRLKEGDC